jgi:hypothetical protein
MAPLEERLQERVVTLEEYRSTSQDRYESLIKDTLGLLTKAGEEFRGIIELQIMSMKIDLDKQKDAAHLAKVQAREARKAFRTVKYSFDPSLQPGQQPTITGTLQQQLAASERPASEQPVSSSLKATRIERRDKRLASEFMYEGIQKEMKKQSADFWQERIDYRSQIKCLC